jgi:hypothetical protein
MSFSAQHHSTAAGWDTSLSTPSRTQQWQWCGDVVLVWIVRMWLVNCQKIVYCELVLVGIVVNHARYAVYVYIVLLLEAPLLGAAKEHSPIYSSVPCHRWMYCKFIGTDDYVGLCLSATYLSTWWIYTIFVSLIIIFIGLNWWIFLCFLYWSAI